MRTTGGERILRITFATPRCRPWYVNVTTRSFTIRPLYISNVSYSCVVFKKECEYLRTVERIYSRSPPRTSWVYFSRHWRPSIPDGYLEHISRSWSTKRQLNRDMWDMNKSTHMMSRSWSVKDNSVDASLECHQWSNTGHTFKTTYDMYENKNKMKSQDHVWYVWE